MKGTEKQITWAENIQKTALDTLQRNIDRMKAANVKTGTCILWFSSE